tara:strand:- start:1079 stop:1336 length:258 start_codon:yes stop_codon:yes gene_type:complete
MTEKQKVFYTLDFITDFKALCEKSENLNGVFQKKQKQIFNEFFTHARRLSDHLEREIPTEDNETAQDILDIKYSLTLEMKKQFTK